MLTRLPVPGRAKTRLVSALGPAGAAALHRDLTEHVALEVSALGATGEAEVEIWHDGGTSGQMQSWLGALPRYRRQPAAGDLGARLLVILEGAFGAGAGRCVAVGSDCPAMTADHLRQALRALEGADLVLGPAADGGYWLVGLRTSAARKALPRLFEGVSWGSTAVLRETLERAAALGLAPVLLEELPDVDREEDLPGWQRGRDPPSGSLGVSVVIPALDEQDQVGSAIRSAREGGAFEVIVADGGSRDATREVAVVAGARVVEAPRGRARQMNAGAALAAGDALVFLHADSALPPRAADRVRAAFAEPRVVAGAFTYRAAADGLLGLTLTTAARLRLLLSGHPYGDQGLFLRRRTFRALGGFPDLPVMEDWELVARLKRLGRVVVLPEAVLTSAASFVDHGYLWSSLVNLAVIASYQLGVDPARLARWRRRVARRSG
jgi:hypothetical protein